ncbi:M3 family metallopeptidase [Halioxenophilus sp. WMMB6]|uniref:M3 family metallopeptidase n=1 Tax=Halioxenophilus sp. WMMB6 TaxID=3073815 RepID=UPI00295F487B|nr:M3 family metallopeptidase [Halioxenophilus sp. WMMB6]
MRKLLITGACLSILASGCGTPPPESTSAATETPMLNPANPFAATSPLDYQTPDFSKIHIDDYEPAFAAGMAEHSAEIEAIANNPEAPTFTNTIVAMENAGALLHRVDVVFGNLSALLSNDEYQRIDTEMAPKLSEHKDNIYLNPKLFERVQAIYDQRDQLQAEDRRLIEVYYTDFVRAGAKLDAAAQARLREINARLSLLATQFSQNILKSFKDDTILVADKSELAGLSEEDIASLAAAAEKAGKTGYLITLVNTTRQPILGQLENRALRQQIWQQSAERAHASNDPVLLEQVQLRAEAAALLGYSNWADYTLDNQMAKTPAPVFKMLDDLAPKALARAKAEAADIQAEISKTGGDFALQPWDWAYYAERVRKAKYDLDEDLLKPYFEFNTVLHAGLFYAMNKLYGITFKERKDLPVWQEDVLAFEVFERDGSSIGLFYLDPYAREGKNGGAWMSSFVDQNRLRGEKPVVYNALNIPKPAAGQPTLMTFDEVTTMFHEFGHADHGLFSDVVYPSLSGTEVPRDFVEFPSQFNEDWDINPEVLKHYARHYQTGEPIPADLLQRLLEAHTFNQGFDTVEYLAAALLDMEWHTLPAGQAVTDVDAFEQAALAKHGLDFAPVPPRYKSAYFSHVFGGGYSAGYYAYLWTEVLAADAFAFQREHGGLTAENGEAYRQAILAIGNSKELMQSYQAFRGQEPGVEALMVRRGLETQSLQ